MFESSGEQRTRVACYPLSHSIAELLSLCLPILVGTRASELDKGAGVYTTRTLPLLSPSSWSRDNEGVNLTSKARLRHTHTLCKRLPRVEKFLSLFPLYDRDIYLYIYTCTHVSKIFLLFSCGLMM